MERTQVMSGVLKSLMAEMKGLSGKKLKPDEEVVEINSEDSPMIAEAEHHDMGDHDKSRSDEYDEKTPKMMAEDEPDGDESPAAAEEMGDLKSLMMNGPSRRLERLKSKSKSC